MSRIGSVILEGLRGGAADTDRASEEARLLAEFARRMQERSADRSAMTGVLDQVMPAPPQTTTRFTGAPAPQVPNPRSGTLDDPGYFAGQAVSGIEAAAADAGQGTDAQSPVGATLARLRAVAPAPLPAQVAGPRPTEQVANPAYDAYSRMHSGFAGASPEMQEHLLPMLQQQAGKMQVAQRFEAAVRRRADDIRETLGNQHADKFLEEALTTGDWPSNTTRPPGLVTPAEVSSFSVLHGAGVNNWHTMAALGMNGMGGEDSGALLQRAQAGDPQAQMRLSQMGYPTSLIRPRVSLRNGAGQAVQVDPATLEGFTSEDPQTRNQAVSDGLKAGMHYGDILRVQRDDQKRRDADPATREAQFSDIVENYGGPGNFTPGAMTLLHAKYVHNKKPLTTSDLKASLVDPSLMDQADASGAAVAYHTQSQEVGRLQSLYGSLNHELDMSALDTSPSAEQSRAVLKARIQELGAHLNEELAKLNTAADTYKAAAEKAAKAKARAGNREQIKPAAKAGAPADAAAATEPDTGEASAVPITAQQIQDRGGVNAVRNRTPNPDPGMKFVTGSASGIDAPAADGAPARISTDQEYDQLPSGARFVGPDGVTRIKP